MLAPYYPHFSIDITTPAAVAVVSTANARAHVNQNHTDDDTYLDALVAAATVQAKKRTGLSLITESMTVRFDDFPRNCHRNQIVLPVGPIQSVTALKYLDTAGVEQTLSASLYSADIYSIPPRIYPAYGYLWPIPQCIQNAVRIELVAGYGNAASDVPPGIVHAIKLLVGHWFRNRESVVVAESVAKLPDAVEMLLDAERQSWL